MPLAARVALRENCFDDVPCPDANYANSEVLTVGVAFPTVTDSLTVEAHNGVASLDFVSNLRKGFDCECYGRKSGTLQKAGSR